MQSLLKNNLPQIITLFNKNKVTRAYTFGSIVSDTFNAGSDIDFLISFSENLSPVEKGENWFSLYLSLKDLLNTEIDLIREEDIKNPYLLNTINASKLLIHG
jgi:uncharacterized protein